MMLNGVGDAKARPPSPRRAHIDAIRILTCSSIMAGHVLAVFHPKFAYHVKNDILLEWAQIAFEMRHSWSVPVFFALAGWSAVTALRAKSVGTFWNSRTRRLVIPLIAGIVLLCPIIKYFELKSGQSLRIDRIVQVAPTTLTYFEFLPRFFTRTTVFAWSHMWFLAYLILITSLTFPLLLRLAQGWQTAKLERLRAILPYLPIPPLALVLWLGKGWWPYYPNVVGDYTNFLYFTALFICGGLMAATPAFENAVIRQWWLLASIGGVAMIALVFHLDTNIGRILAAIAAWGVFGGLFGGLSKLTLRAGRTFRYLAEATLPVFVIHHPVVVVAAWYIVSWELSAGTKLIILLVVALVAPVLLYHVAIRPFGTTRFLFGAPRRRPAPKSLAAFSP